MAHTKPSKDWQNKTRWSVPSAMKKKQRGATIAHKPEPTSINRMGPNLSLIQPHRGKTAWYAIMENELVLNIPCSGLDPNAGFSSLKLVTNTATQTHSR